MATIESYETASGRKYQVRYRTPQRSQTKKRGFKTKRDALEFANTVEVEKMTGSYVAPSLGMITVGELAPAWLARKESDVAESNYRMLESSWRVHVQPVWGATRITDVELNAVETWIAAINKKFGTTTVVRAYTVLCGILDDSVKAKRLRANPARGADNLPRRTSRRHVYLSADDVHRLADECGEHRPLILVLGFCGLRWGEAIALRVRDIEFLKRRIQVSENAVQLNSRFVVGSTKGRTNRAVPVPQFVLDELSVQCGGRDMGDLVFGDGEHYLLRPKSERGWFVRAVKAAGVQRVTPHDLRHACASIAISAGVNVLALQRMLGPQVGQSHVGHLRRLVRLRP